MCVVCIVISPTRAMRLRGVECVGNLSMYMGSLLLTLSTSLQCNQIMANTCMDASGCDAMMKTLPFICSQSCG